MGAETKTTPENESGKRKMVNTRIILLISVVVALVFLVVGGLIGHFVIEKTCNTDKNDGRSLTDRCQQDQFTAAHKAYSER